MKGKNQNRGEERQAEIAAVGSAHEHHSAPTLLLQYNTSLNTAIEEKKPATRVISGKPQDCYFVIASAVGLADTRERLGH
jgi:hypothetical protein